MNLNFLKFHYIVSSIQRRSEGSN